MLGFEDGARPRACHYMALEIFDQAPAAAEAEAAAAEAEAAAAEAEAVAAAAATEAG